MKNHGHNSILEAGNLVKVKLRPDKNWTFDARQNNGLLESNLPIGTSLKGKQTLLIQEAVLGTSNTPCNINLKKDVIGTGDTAHAHIQGGNIYLVRNLQHNRLDASENIDSTNVVSSKLTVGSFEVHRHQINGLNYRLQLAQEKHAALQRQIEIEDRRIVQQKHGRVKIDLKNFYLSFNAGSQRKTNQVLKGFFAKDIVSVLARANRKYLLKNPAREKIFLELLKKLRALFFWSTITKHSTSALATMSKLSYLLLKGLNKQDRTICIQGILEPDSELIFILPSAMYPTDGAADFKYQSVHLKVKSGTNGEHLHLETQNASGGKSSQNLSRTEFKNLSLQIHEGTIVWKPLGATQA